MTLETERRNFIRRVGATAASTAMPGGTQAFAQTNQPTGAKPMTRRRKHAPESLDPFSGREKLRQ
jgi:superoxide dismutase, Fe-Mn family